MFACKLLCTCVQAVRERTADVERATQDIARVAQMLREFPPLLL